MFCHGGRKFLDVEYPGKSLILFVGVVGCVGHISLLFQPEDFFNHLGIIKGPEVHCKIIDINTSLKAPYVKKYFDGLAWSLEHSTLPIKVQIILMMENILIKSICLLNTLQSTSSRPRLLLR